MRSQGSYITRGGDRQLHHNAEREVASIIANVVWNKSRDIRDCLRIGKLARSVEEVEFVVDTFLGTSRDQISEGDI